MNVDEAMAYASKDKCFWTGEVHTALETLAAEVERLRAELDQYKKSLPVCEKHKPDSGCRSGCMICGLEKQSSALSRIDYACGKPNIMQISLYDWDYDEERVVKAVQRLKTELAQLRKDWCDDDEAIKQQALRVIDAAKVEGDSVYVPRMGALAEMMADEIERLRIWNKRWRDVSARLRLTLAELISEELKQGKHYET